jgi:2-methylcitrate dehydratase PrpD
MKEEPIKVEDIVEIIVEPRFEKEASRMIYRPNGYQSITDAQFSIPYCIAAFLLDPKPGPNWFSDERLEDPDVLRIAAKVKAKGLDMSPLDAFALFQNGDYPRASVEIITANGSRVSKVLPFPKGHPKNKLSEEEFKSRFKETASFVLKTGQIDQIMDKVLALEDVEDINEITEPIQLL